MIPTRTFQKIGNTRVIGFDTKLAAFGVVRDHSLKLIVRYNSYNKKSRIFPNFEPVPIDHIRKWSGPPVEIIMKYTSTFIRYIAFMCKIDIGWILSDISVCSKDYRYCCLKTGKSNILLESEYLVNIDYRVIKFQEFV